MRTYDLTTVIVPMSHTTAQMALPKDGGALCVAAFHWLYLSACAHQQPNAGAKKVPLVVVAAAYLAGKCTDWQGPLSR